MDVPNSNFSLFGSEVRKKFGSNASGKPKKPEEKTAEPINQAASRLQAAAAAAAETPAMAGPNCGARNPGYHAVTLADGGSKHGGAEVG